MQTSSSMTARRFLLVLGLSAALPLAVAGCGRPSAEEPHPIRAVATISILADFVAAVGGDLVRVEPIVPVGGDPHVYEPTPGDARRVAAAAIVVRNGLGLEPWLDRLTGASRPDRPVITLTGGLGPLVQEGGTGAGDPDPHLWMDPLLARRYVDGVRAALARIDPANTASYAGNADRYLRQLDDLDRWIADQIARVPRARRKLVTTHDAFRYFGVRYGLDVVGTIWSVSTERRRSAKRAASRWCRTIARLRSAAWESWESFPAPS
jgi:zinc/manganese transport system substrate-binding protein